MSDKLDRGMFERYREVQILASLDDIRQPDVSIDAKRSLIEKLRATYRDYAWIGLTDANGKVLASTDGLLEGESVAERPWFQQGKQAPFAGDVHEALLLEKLLDNDSNEPMRFVDVAAPVFDQSGILQGVFGAHLSWTWAQEVEQSLLESLGQLRQIDALILSADDLVLLGPDSLKEQVLTLQSAESAEDRKAGYILETWPDQREYLTGFSPSQGYRDFKGLGWVVLVRQSSQAALAGARFLQQQVFSWGALLGGLFALASWLQVRRMVRAILMLNTAANRIQQAEPNVSIPLLSGRDELSILSASLHHLVQTLNVRTRSLSTANDYLQRDLINRQQNESKIRKQAALLDIATDAILVRDMDGVIQYWNRGAETIYGWCAEEACGKNAVELLNGSDAEKVSTALTAVVETGEWKGELTQLTRSGSEVIVISRWTLVHDELARPTAILTVATDITEAKLLEVQFLRTQRLESLGTLSSGIAHDLNNVLTPVMAASQLLPIMLPDIDEKADTVIKTLYSSAKRASDMVNQILTFARGASGDHILVQVGHILDELKQVLQSSFPKDISIQVSTDAALWLVLADATQLQQIFMNLCVNARDAMPQGGVLTLFAENIQLTEQNCHWHPDARTGPYVVVSVADTGIGMSDALIAKIFDPFFTTKDVGKGTGLGLSTAIGIIRSHGGFVRVESEEGKGTRFQVYLPAHENSDVETTSEDCKSIGHGELILIVDDEMMIQEMTKTALETYSYRVITASNGREAIDKYAQHKDEIQLVVMGYQQKAKRKSPRQPVSINTCKKALGFAAELCIVT